MWCTLTPVEDSLNASAFSFPLLHTLTSKCFAKNNALRDRVTVNFIICTGIYYGRLTALLAMTFSTYQNEIRAPRNLLINIINHKNSSASQRHINLTLT